MSLRASLRRPFLFLFDTRYRSKARGPNRYPEAVVNCLFAKHLTIQEQARCIARIDHNSSQNALYGLNKLLTLPRSPDSPGRPPASHLMNLETARTQMLGQQLRAWDVLDERVLRTFSEMPREQFVPAEHRDLAFADTEIPLGHQQVMLAPKMEGRVLQALSVEPIDDVLVVGTGSGYLTACVSQLGRKVTSVDIFPDFVTAAEAKLAARGIRNVALKTADALALSQPGSFDAIAVTASVPELDRHFVEMLRPEGRLFIVVGREPVMEATLVTMRPDGSTMVEGLFETVLTPLINASRPEPFVL